MAKSELMMGFKEIKREHTHLAYVYRESNVSYGVTGGSINPTNINGVPIMECLSNSSTNETKLDTDGYFFLENYQNLYLGRCDTGKYLGRPVSGSDQFGWATWNGVLFDTKDIEVNDQSIPIWLASIPLRLRDIFRRSRNC